MAEPMAAPLRVHVVCNAGPRQTLELALDLAPGSTVAQALHAFAASTGLDLQPYTNAGHVGVWGRKAPPHQVLQALDRVELYRPLQVDPKVARRERFKRQGSKTAGLFAQRRANAKPGY